jgi:hypothetical protein
MLEADGPVEADWTHYVSDLKLLFQQSSLASDERLQKQLFLVRFGDNVEFALHPVLSKTRIIGDENAILLPLNVERHFGLAFQRVVQENSPDDFPFEDKVAKVSYGTDVRMNPLHSTSRSLLFTRSFGAEPRQTMDGTRCSAPRIIIGGYFWRNGQACRTHIWTLVSVPWYKKSCMKMRGGASVTCKPARASNHIIDVYSFLSIF